ncbi:MAG: molybdate ABC transporter permease subunit, partial [Nannocystaceae bacterium]
NSCESLSASGRLAAEITAAAAILAATFVAMPLIVLAGESAFRNLSRDHDEVARALGASLRVRLYHVMLPQLRRPLIAAVALCFGRALGEFGATITFAGSFPGRTRTVPLAVYQLLQRDQDSAIALSVALVLLSFLIMIFSGKVIRSS